MDEKQNIPIEKIDIKSNRLKFRLPIIFMAVFALFGAVFITASQASPAPPNGYFEIVTYEGSVTPGREIGSVNVSVTPGGSGKPCIIGSGTTDPAGGPNHGHIRLTCPASASGGSREFTLGDFTRDGYTKDAASPHQPGDKIHISGTGNSTTVSLVLDGIPPPQQPTSTAPPPGTGSPSSTKSPDGTLNIVTFVEPGGTGNELGNVVVAVDQGGSNVYCDKRSATTDNLGKGTNANYGHAHLTCPAAQDGGPRTYRLVSASKANYTISPDSPIQIGQTFRVNPGDNNLLIILKNTPGTALTPIPPPVVKPPYKEGNSKKPAGSNSDKKDDKKKPSANPSASCNALSNLKLSDCKENKEKEAESTSSSNTLIIYSSKGAYKYVGLLGFTNTQCGTHKLKLTQAEGKNWSGNSFASLAEGNLVTIKTPSKSIDGSYAPLRLDCKSSVKNDEKRNIAVLFKKSGNESLKQFVRKTDVNSYTNSCIFVHEWGISRVISRHEGSCDTGGETDLPSRKQVSLKVKTKNNTSDIEQVQLTSPQRISSADCADAQRLSWQYARQDKTYVTSYSTSLVWKNEQCLSNETVSNRLPDGKYAITLKFSGSKNLSPFTHDIMYRTIGKLPGKSTINTETDDTGDDSENIDDESIATASGATVDRAVLLVARQIAGKELSNKVGIGTDEDRTYIINIQGPGRTVINKATSQFGTKFTDNPIGDAVVKLSSKNRSKRAGCGWNGPINRNRDSTKSTNGNGSVVFTRCTNDNFSLKLTNIPVEYVLPGQTDRNAAFSINDGRYIQLERVKSGDFDGVMITITLQHRTTLAPFTQAQRTAHAAAASKYWHQQPITQTMKRYNVVDIRQTTYCKPNQVRYEYVNGIKGIDSLAKAYPGMARPDEHRNACVVYWNTHPSAYPYLRNRVTSCLTFVHEYGHLLGHFVIKTGDNVVVGHSSNPDNIMYPTINPNNGHLLSETGCH